MFIYYEGRVSDNEYFYSAEPSKEEIVFFVDSIEMQIEMGIPILRALRVTHKITPTKKIRKKIEDIITDLESGINTSESFLHNLKEIDSDIIKNIERKEKFEYEIKQYFSRYVKDRPHIRKYNSSKIIGRSIELISFTDKMHKNLSKGNTILESLKESAITTSSRFEEITSTLPSLYIKENSLVNSIYQRFDDEFDYLWINIIDAGEGQKNSYEGIKKSFEILSRS